MVYAGSLLIVAVETLLSLLPQQYIIVTGLFFQGLHSRQFQRKEKLPSPKVVSLKGEQMSRFSVAGVLTGVRLHFRCHLRTTPALLFRQ